VRYLPRIFIFGRPCEQRLSHYVFGVVGCLCDVSVVLGDKINGTLVSSSTSYVISQIPEMSASSFIFCGGGGASVQRFAVTTNFFHGFLQFLQSDHRMFSKVSGRKCFDNILFSVRIGQKILLEKRAFLLGYQKRKF